MTMKKEVEMTEEDKRALEEASDRFAGLLVDLLITQAEREAENEAKKLENETSLN